MKKTARVLSNDPRKPTVNIGLGCSIKQYVSVEPANRIVFSGFEGDTIKKKITIASIEKKPFKITEITSDIEDKIKYKLKTIEKGKKYSLEVKNCSSQKGKFKGKIKLKTNSEKKPLVVINLYGTFAEELRMKPKSISFGTIDTSVENAGMIKSIVLRDIRGEGITIKKIKTSSDWIMTETKIAREGKRCIVKVMLDKDKLPKGQFSEKIKIRTNYKREYLEVDVTGEVI